MPVGPVFIGRAGLELCLGLGRATAIVSEDPTAPGGLPPRTTDRASGRCRRTTPRKA